MKQLQVMADKQKKMKDKFKAKLAVMTTSLSDIHFAIQELTNFVTEKTRLVDFDSVMPLFKLKNKYHLSLPIQTLPDFITFDGRLKVEEDLSVDLVSLVKIFK